MVLNKLKSYLLLISVILASTLQVGCSGNEDLDSEQGIVVSGTLTDSPAQQKLSFSKGSALAISEYEVYCVTFTDIPHSATSAISSNGDFSLQMPAKVSFGCFINNVETKVPVAVMAIAGEGDSFGDDTSTALQFSGNANFGDLAIDLSRSQVLIPRTRVKDVIQVAAQLNLKPDDLNGKSYKMKCILSGHSYLDQACQQDMASEGEDTVYFRIMSAMRNNEAIKGIGVWRSQKAFNDCGGIDLMDSEVAGLASDDGIVFDAGGIVSGPSYTDGVLCPLRDDSRPVVQENINYYYAAGELITDANGYNLHTKDFHLVNPGCLVEQTTAVRLSGNSAQRLIGHFNKSEAHINLDNGLGDCSHLTLNPIVNFMVEFTQQ